MENAIARHTPMVYTAARTHWSRIRDKSVAVISLDDLVQVGLIALVDGLSRYDPTIGASEHTFLWKTVYLRMQREISTHNHMFKTTEEFKRLASKIHASGELDAELWAKRFGITRRYAQDMIDYLSTRWTSLDIPLDDDEDSPTLYEIIATPTDDEEAAWERIDELCKTEFERTIVRLIAAGYVQREISEMTGRPEYSVWKSFRAVRRRYKGGQASEEKAVVTSKKRKKDRPGTAVYGRNLAT